MSETGEEKTPKTYDEQGHIIDPTPIKISLHSGVAIRRELASVYRDMRAGRIECQDGTRMAYVLDMIRKAHETEVLERRLTEVEKLLNHRNTRR